MLFWVRSKKQMESLPDDLFTEIFLKIPRPTYRTVARTCSWLEARLKTPKLWMAICQREKVFVWNQEYYNSARRVLSRYWRWVKNAHGYARITNGVTADFCGSSSIASQSVFTPLHPEACLRVMSTDSIFGIFIVGPEDNTWIMYNGVGRSATEHDEGPRVLPFKFGDDILIRVDFSLRVIVIFNGTVEVMRHGREDVTGLRVQCIAEWGSVEFV